MKDTKPHRASSTSLCDIRQNADGAIQVSLLGTSGPLKDAQLLVQEAARVQALHVLAYHDPVPPQEHDFRVTHVTFTLDGLTPEAALELVHRATRCDIGASIRANYTTYDTRNKRGQTNTSFIPTADITVQHDDPFMQETIATYLRNRLDDIFTGLSENGWAGTIGLPSEYNYSGNLRAEARRHKTIELTFPERKTTQGHRAKMDANAIAEHLSGLLGIAETLAPARKTNAPRRF